MTTSCRPTSPTQWVIPPPALLLAGSRIAEARRPKLKLRPRALRSPYARTVLLRLVASVLAPLGVLLALSGCSPTRSSDDSRPLEGPSSCQRGFPRALATEIGDVQAVAVIKPSDIGFAELRPMIACVVRLDSSSTGAFAVVVMRATLTEDDVRYALYDLDFGEPRHSVMIRERPDLGEVRAASFRTYGALTSEWRGRRAVFHGSFPPTTVVLSAPLRIPHELRKCETSGYSAYPARSDRNAGFQIPRDRVISCRPWTAKEVGESVRDALPALPSGARCRDVTSYDYNWQNDMLCTRADGTQFFTDYEGAASFLGH